MSAPGGTFLMLSGDTAGRLVTTTAENKKPIAGLP